MDRFADEVCRLELGPRVALWHRRTGRSLTLTRTTLHEVERWTPGLEPPPDLRAVARRLDELHLLRESEQPDVSTLIAARNRMVLTLPDNPSLWLPLPTVRTPGGFAYAERALSTSDLAVWRAINGARTVAQVAERAGVALEPVLRFLDELTCPELQAVQLRATPVRARDPGLRRLIAPERPPAPRPPHLRGDHGETTLQHYHRHLVTDGQTHFDDRETTVAHAFARPHPALDGEPFGWRLHAVLEARGLLPADDAPVLEIGPGSGELGCDFLDRASRRGVPTGEMIRLDASPELLATQRRRQPGTRELLGSATAIPLPERSVGLVLCNEVIADLSAVPYDASEAESDGPVAEVATRLERYGIDPLPGRALYNLGAWQLVEELARVLRPGGAAYVSEFGATDEVPTETRHLDHPEVSIHFGHLATVARALGLDAQVVPLPEFMGFQLGAQWLSRHSYEALRAVVRASRVHLPARAWTPATLKPPLRVEGLDWVPITEDGPGPVVTRFQALILRR